MKRNAVQVGKEYQLKQSGQHARVRIESARSSGGWDAINVATGLTVRVKHSNSLSPIPVVQEPAAASETTLVEELPADAEVTTAEPVPAEVPAPTAIAELKPKRLSALDAAAVILAAETEPMTAKQLIEKMTAQGLWASPGGKTPDATLASALIREITKKGTQSRFVKAAPGRFATRNA